MSMQVDGKVIKIRTDNIYFLDQYTLLEKLKIAMHPTVIDNTDTINLIETEINYRKETGLWLVDN